MKYINFQMIKFTEKVLIFLNDIEELCRNYELISQIE